MNNARPILLVALRDRHLAEAYAAAARDADLEAVAVDTAEDAGRWLETRYPLAIAVDMGARDAEAACFRIRMQSKLSNVPILGLASEVGDLAFPEIYGWGGDDVVLLGNPAAVMLRARILVNDGSLQPPASKGYAVVADGDQRRRILTARVLHNAGYDVRFAVDAEEAVEASCTEGVKLVVADADLEPGGGPNAARKSRERGVAAPWVLAAEPKRLSAARALVADIPKVAVTDSFAPPENVLFVANELGRSGATEGRGSARLLYGTVVSFRAAGRDEDMIGFTYNISGGGLYVRTLTPLAATDEAWIELRPPRTERRVRLEGKVVWRRRFGPIESATVPPGFGIQIVDATPTDLARYRAGYTTFAETAFGAAVPATAATPPTPATPVTPATPAS